MLRSDALAGLTVSLISLPLAMSFAIAAGLDPEFGLVSAIVAGAVAALLGGSELNITGPAGALIGILTGVMIEYGYQDVLVVGLLAGAVLIVAGISGIGKHVHLVPYPVILGFTGGIGVIIMSTQFGAALGITDLPSHEHLHDRIGDLFGALDRTSMAALGVTALTIAVIEIARRILPRAAAPLTGIIVAGVVVWAFDLDVMTVEAMFGALPQSLPAPAIPPMDIDRVLALLPIGATIAALASLETLLSATASDAMANKRHNSSAELVGCGIANMAAALFGGIPVCGAIARTTLNTQSGAKSRIAAVFNALSLLLMMLLLAPVVGQIPLSALAGLLLLVAVKMMDVRRYVELLAHHHWADFAMLAVTLLLTMFVSLIAGVGAGLAVALLSYVVRVRRAASHKGHEHDPAHDHHHEDAPVGVVTVGGPLFFYTIRRVIDHAGELAPTKALVLRLNHSDPIDASGVEALKDVARTHGPARAVYLSGVSTRNLDLFERTGIVELIGENHIFERTRDAVAAAKAA